MGDFHVFKIVQMVPNHEMHHNKCWIDNLHFIELKVVSATFLLICLVSLKESTCETKKNAFYFTSKVLFVLEILTFQILKCHDIIKCLSMLHETFYWIISEVNTLMKFGQFM